VCDRASKVAKRKECSFVFDKLLTLEAEYPVTNFVATDGSKDIDAETGAIRVGRACLAVELGALGCSALGGQLDVYADTFERHSYEAELAAFHDYLAATENTVTVVVTDCLSGMQSGHAFTGRTVSSKAARYRDKELGNISELEQRHRAILYVHVHSHDGITPNEAADVAAKRMLDSPFLPLDLMPSAHAKCRILGVKRGVGRAAFDFCSAYMVAKLAEASSFTLLETSDTWTLFRRGPVRNKLLTEATYDCVLDARADRCGLLADRLGSGLLERVLPGQAQLDQLREYRPQKGSWEWWCQTHAPCPCTGCFQAKEVTVAGIWRPPPARAPQERWHTITTCCLGEMPELRLKAAGWLSHRLSDFGTRQAYYALSALSGDADRLQPRERHAALRFFLGLPDEPKSQLIVESPEAARSLALAYGRGFLKWIVAILRQGSTAALAARKGPRAKVNAVRTTVVCHRDLFRVIERPAPRSVWMGPCGLLLWPGTLRWMCEGVGCDLDICLECVAKDGAEGSSRGHTRCSQGHSMLFRLATAHTHIDRRCDGECRRSLGEGMWTYECAPCSLDLCAACAPGGIQPGDEPARAARAPRKRAREPPPHRARGRQMAHGDGPPRRASKSERRRNLFDGDSDGGPDSDEFAQPAAQGGAHGLCGKRPRESEESPSREAGGPQRQPYGEGPGRKRSAPPSIHSRGQGL
jgi:ribonuclease HI